MPGHGELPVVAGIDGSAVSVRAARWAAAAAVQRGVGLWLVEVYTIPRLTLPLADDSLETVRAELAGRAAASLSAVRKAIQASWPELDVRVGAREWSPVTALVQESGHAELLVLGAHGLGGFPGMLIGSTAAAVAIHATCPVVVVHGPIPAHPLSGRPVVVGADGSTDSDAALGFACEEAVLRGTGLTVVHTWSDILADGALRPHPLELDPARIEQAERAKLADQVARWQDKFPDLAITLDVVRGRPVRTLLERGEAAELLVVGCRGRGGFPGMLLGSTSQALERVC